MTQASEDSSFSVITLRKTEKPQILVYQALHQDYSSFPVCTKTPPGEKECGEIAIKRLLVNSHWGPLEHPAITFNCVNFPHSVVQQARTHRIGVSWDVQSFRYTEKIEKLGYELQQIVENENIDGDFFDKVESLFYLRPPGRYASRDGFYEYTKDIRSKDLGVIATTAINYYHNTQAGMPPEQARGVIAFDYRQHFVATFNLRSLMHFLDLRGKKDAQWEIQQLAELMFIEAKKWCPEIMGWYEEKRWKKGRTAP